MFYVTIFFPGWLPSTLLLFLQLVAVFNYMNKQDFLFSADIPIKEERKKGESEIRRIFIYFFGWQTGLFQAMCICNKLRTH